MQNVRKAEFHGRYAIFLTVIHWWFFTLGGLAIFYYLFVLSVMYNPNSGWVSPDDPLNLVLAGFQTLTCLAHLGYSLLVGMLVDVAFVACVVYTSGRVRQLVWLTCLLCFAANGVITWFALMNGARVYNSSIWPSDLQIFAFPIGSILWLSLLSAPFSFPT